MKDQHSIITQETTDPLGGKKLDFYSSKHLFPLAILYLFLTYSCEKKVVNSEVYNQTITIDPTLAKDYNIDEVFESIEYLSLDNKEHFVGSIDKVLVNNNQYYVLDKDYTNSLYVYDESGKYVRKIGNEGDGPTDYGDINDFTIVDVEGSQQIWMLDNLNSYFSISKYSLSGKFIQKTRSSLMADFIDFIPSGKLLFSTSNQCNDDFCSDLFTTDLNLKLISKVNKPQELYEKFWFEPNNPISASQTGVSAVSYGHTTITKVDLESGKLVNDIKVDFGSFDVPPDIMEKYYGSIEGFLLEMQRGGNCYQIDNLFHFNKNLFFSFNYGSKKHYYMKSPHHDKELIIKKFILDAGIGVVLPLSIIGGHKNTLFSLLDSEELMEFYEDYRDKMENKESQFQNLLKSLTNSSNPVILKLRFK